MQATKKTVEKFAVRRATANDYGSVQELLVNAGLTTKEFFTRQRFTDTIADFGKYNLVAQMDGKVVGYVYGYDDSGKSGKPKFYGWMGRLVVDPEYRYRGIGKCLTDTCLAEFKRAGYEVVFAGVKMDNLISKQLLERAGFKNDGYLLLYVE